MVLFTTTFTTSSMTKQNSFSKSNGGGDLTLVGELELDLWSWRAFSFFRASGEKPKHKITRGMPFIPFVCTLYSNRNSRSRILSTKIQKLGFPTLVFVYAVLLCMHVYRYVNHGNIIIIPPWNRMKILRNFVCFEVS